MSNISSLDTWKITLMHWIARILSIPWAFWALFWTFFIVAQPNKDGEYLPTVALTIILSIVALMYVGAAIIASVWGKEAFGGSVLLLDGVLLFISVAVMTDGFEDFFHNSDFTILAFSTVLPPLIAGYLFLICHRRTKT